MVTVLDRIAARLAQLVRPGAPQAEADIASVIAFVDGLFDVLIKAASEKAKPGRRIGDLTRGQLAVARRRFMKRMAYLAQSNVGEVRWAAHLLAAMASVVPSQPRRVPFPGEDS
jgi:hypothetical protein